MGVFKHAEDNEQQKKETLNYPPLSEMDRRDFRRAFISKLGCRRKFRLLVGIFYGLTFEAVLKIDKGKLEIFDKSI